MMLQGHFIDVTLSDEFRQADHWLYAGWSFMRGLTAPVFFTATGIVFVYLLLGQKTEKIADHQRWRKGIRRGFFLLAIGYLLRMNLASVAMLQFHSWIFQTDVLHCIGIALIFLCGLYALSQQRKDLFAGLLLFFGISIFLTAPFFASLNVDGLLPPLRHYVNNSFGAIFSPLPWIGYSCFGGLLGLAIRYRGDLVKYNLFIGCLLVLGFGLNFYSSDWLMTIHQFTEVEMFRDVAYFNAYFTRLGQCMIVIAIIMLLTRNLSRLPEWINKTGSETLTIYATHYVLLYGTWFGLGMAYFWAHSLPPIVAAAGAFIFVVGGVVLALHLDRIRQFRPVYFLMNFPRKVFSALR